MREERTAYMLAAAYLYALKKLEERNAAEESGLTAPGYREREHAKSELKKKGWSYRAAAKVTGRTAVHISYVLNGQRTSQRLLQDLVNLPPRTDIPHNSPYRKTKEEE